jgi:hypothetical protein
MADCLKLWPELCEREGRRVLSAVNDITQILQDGESAAAFTHNPLIRLAQRTATGSCEGPEIEHCQSICFVFDGDKFVGCEEHLF